MSEVTFDQIVIVVLLILAAIQAANTVLTFFKNFKEAKKPHDDHIAEVREHGVKLNNDHQSLTDHEARINRMEKNQKENDSQNRIIISALKALLMHEIDGVNHIEELKVEYGILNRYLSGDLPKEVG